MPPFLPVILAGAAMYGAFKWAQRQVLQHAEQAARAAEEMRRRATGAPRDLGTLEFDAASGVYKPRASLR